MSIEWFLYLADIANSLGAFFSISGLIMIVSGVILLIDKYIDDEEVRASKTLLFFITFIGAMFFITSCFIPSEKTIYLIAGAHELKSSDVSNKVEAVIEKKLDEYLKDDAK